MPKSQRLISPLLWLLVGAGYFSAVSQFALHPLLKDYLVIVPLQVLAIVYIFLLRRVPNSPASPLTDQQKSSLLD